MAAAAAAIAGTAGASLANGTPAILAFNRGLVSRFALARLDMKRMAFSAELMTNWMSRVLGPMGLRAGLGFLGSVAGQARMLPFVFSTDDTALVEISNLTIRVWVGDRLISRPGVSTTVTNGNFTTNLTGWTDNDEGGAASAWNLNGYMELVGTGTEAAIRDQQVAVVSADQGTEHSLSIVIAGGPVTLRVGSTAGGDEYVTETSLETGAHSLAFTPSGNFHIRLMSRAVRATYVDSVTVEGGGVMRIPAPWVTTDLRKIRADQSGDVLFVACKGYQQRRIERRGARSWSIVLYQPPDGPFRAENVGPITLTASGLTGNITLTASAPLFRSGHGGALWRMTSEGQRVEEDITAENTFSDPIEVTNVGEGRRFTITRTGTWSATVTLQRSIGEVGLWEDVESYTDNASITYADELDNQVVFYRIGVKTGDFTSGTVELALFFPLGSITGIVRTLTFSSSTSMSAEVVKDLGGTTATDIWSEGVWSPYRGWPTSVVLYEGRLWWLGKNAVVASISDAFDSFDPSFEGAAGPINRTIGSGPVDDIQWVLPLKRLLVGAEGGEIGIRSTTFDEPITPTNFNIKPVSSQGSSDVNAAHFDNRGVFVQRCGSRLYELAYSVETNDYDANDLTAMVPEVGEPGIVAIAVQRQPDTRIHCVRSDGVVAVAVIDRAENVLSWQLIETDGVVEEVVVLPGTTEDAVYYVVDRSVNGEVTTITVTDNGSGYDEPPELLFVGGSGSGATGTTRLGYFGDAAIDGTDYAIGDVLTLEGGEGSIEATIQVVTVDSNGGITASTVLEHGEYTEIPIGTIRLIGGSGRGATIAGDPSLWGVSAGYVTSGGSGYTSTPTIGVSGSGAGAALTATTLTAARRYLERFALQNECQGGSQNKQADSFISYVGQTTSVSGGIVSELSVTAGFGYLSQPAVGFSGGGGSGAAASVTLKLVSFGISVLGSGYSNGDILTLVGGTFTRPARLQVMNTFGPGLLAPLNGLSIIDGGEYTVPPAAAFASATLSGGTGAGAAIYPVWGLGTASITNPGSGYTSQPTVTLSVPPLGTDQLSTPGVAGTITASVIAGSTETVEASTNVINGLDHLNGKEVVVWADGADLSPDDDEGNQRTYTVQGGSISLDRSVSRAVVGLPYRARWKSTKLASVTEEGMATGLNQRKRIVQLGLVLADTLNRGIRFGPDFETMDPLPEVERDALVSSESNHVWTAYDEEMIEFPGEWSTDSRLCLEAKAPRPCTVLAVVMSITQGTK